MTYTFIDLFAGIGGFHAAFDALNAEYEEKHKAAEPRTKCVFASEMDPYARLTYSENFIGNSGSLSEEQFVGDITKFDKSDVPDFDILCGGFPCQPFSQAGQKLGFEDRRGNLFFEIMDIIETKQMQGCAPKAIFLENVQHLLRHDGGKTIATIREILGHLGYRVHEFIVRAKNHGLPQLRPRIFIIGMLDSNVEIVPPPIIPLVFTMTDVWCADVGRDVGFTLRVGGKSSPVTDRRNWDGYVRNSEVVRLEPWQGLLMQGFPHSFRFPVGVSRSQQMKQLGNSVAVWAVRDYANLILQALDNSYLNAQSG